MKSGSTFIARVLALYFGAERIEPVPYWGRLEQHLDEHLLEPYLDRDFVIQMHLRPHKPNVEIIRKLGLSTVYVWRNLGDVIVSFNDHVRNEDHHNPVCYIHDRDRYLAMPIQARYSYLIQHAIPWYVGFYLSWRAIRPDLPFIETHYEDLARDPFAYFASLVRALGHQVDEARLRGLLGAGPPGTRFNKGVNGRSTGLLSDDNKRLLEAMLRSHCEDLSELVNELPWRGETALAPQWTPGASSRSAVNMSESFRLDPAAVAAGIVRALHPLRALCTGPGADEIAAALGALGVEVAPGGSADLAVCTGPVDTGTVASLASQAGSILVGGADLPLATLGLLSGLGFTPQADFDGGFLGGGVLFRRTGAAPSDRAALVEALESQRLALDRLDGHVARTQARLDDILQSRIWRTLCAGSAVLLKAAALARRAGLLPARHDTNRTVASDAASYARWIEDFERADDSSLRLKRRAFIQHPLLSVVVPVYRPARADLERAIASVRAQSYSNWELCLADDGSDSQATAEALARAAASDARIRVTALSSHGGISAASNAALALARGEYVALLDHDDELAPDALLHVVDEINRRPAAGVLYSDEDKIDASGNRYDPFFKPDWSPDLLLSENYVSHFLVARREFVERAGGFRTEYDGAQDYDLILRLSESATEVAHIPRVLYHWRAAAGSAAAEPDAKPYAAEAGRRAVEDHLRRRGLSATVVPGRGPGRLRVRYPIPPDSRAGILIPSGGHAGVLRTCLGSLAAKTAYPDYEVIVVDNSREGLIERLVRSWEGGHAVRYLDWRGRPFNYSAMNNAAARECGAPLLVFLNDDTEVLDPGWLEAMIELGARPDAGAIGAKLLYPDGRIQHAGVALDILGSGGHVFRGLDSRAPHYFDFPDVIRNVSAVTGACLLVRAAAFEQAGGFDEVRFPISFNDVDLCLRLGRLGLKNLYTPHALLRHHESLSRAPRNLRFDPAGYAALRARWLDLLDSDPYYSPNLTRTAEDCTVRRRV